MAKKTALIAFGEAITRETHLTLSKDALHRVLIHFGSNVLDPSTIQDITILSMHALRVLEDMKTKRLANVQKAGSSLEQLIIHNFSKEERNLEAAAATVLRELSVRQLIAESYINLSKDWEDEEGNQIKPPTAQEWAVFKAQCLADVQSMRDTVSRLEAEQAADKELIVTTQEVKCTYCDNGAISDEYGVHRCTVCNATGKREIEIARNKPVPTQEPEQDAAQLWEAKVRNNGYSPTTRRAFIDGYLYATANAED